MHEMNAAAPVTAAFLYNSVHNGILAYAETALFKKESFADWFEIHKSGIACSNMSKRAPAGGFMENARIDLDGLPEALPGAAVLRGMAFLGDRIALSLEVGGAPVTVDWPVEAAPPAPGLALAPGEAVALSWDPADMAVFAATGPADAPP